MAAQRDTIAANAVPKAWSVTSLSSGSNGKSFSFVGSADGEAVNDRDAAKYLFFCEFFEEGFPDGFLVDGTIVGMPVVPDGSIVEMPDGLIVGMSDGLIAGGRFVDLPDGLIVDVPDGLIVCMPEGLIDGTSLGYLSTLGSYIMVEAATIAIPAIIYMK